MKPQIINQEILLLTGSKFFNRPFCKKDKNQQPDFSSMEELEKACWDGMLNELLPELFDNDDKSKNYLWNTISGVNFLCVNMSPYPMSLEKSTSIDPYFFAHEADKLN
jgi:hypothetical protein